MMIDLLIVEDNFQLRNALKTGLEATGGVKVIFSCASGEEALEFCLERNSGALYESHLKGKISNSERPPIQVILMDVQLAGKLNGIQAATAIRREFPRLPVVFYSIQDDEAYYRDFRRSGILSHYAYVRKSNYLLPHMILPLLGDALAGRSFIDPEIEARVQEVRHKDENDPMAVLEPNEQVVARMLSQGMTNEQIAAQMGFRDKRTISRTNGQIYAAWGLDLNTTDEKVARTRAAIIVQYRQMISWDGQGNARVMNERGDWVPFEP